jgi:hypothetical protein
VWGFPLPTVAATCSIGWPRVVLSGQQGYLLIPRYGMGRVPAMERDERTEPTDVVQSRGKLSVSFAVPAELGRGSEKQSTRAFEALADQAYEEAIDILDRTRVLPPIQPCRIRCRLTLHEEAEDAQDLCQQVFQACLRGFEDAGLIDDFDAFLELNSTIDVVPQLGDADEACLDFEVERVYERARTRVSRKRRQVLEERAGSAGRQFGRGPRLLGFVVAGSAFLVMVGAFLPWGQALGGLVKANGTDGDGVITLVVALVGGGLSLGIAFGRKRNSAVWTGLGAFVCGGIIGAVAAYDLNNLNNVIEEMEQENQLFDPGLTAGSGLYLTLVAGIVMALSSVMVVLTAQDRAAVSEP